MRIKGINAVQGTGDSQQSMWEVRMQEVAYRYALRYNRSLLHHLRGCADPDLLRLQRESESELSHMESADPLSDARVAVGHGDVRLTGVAQDYRSSQIPGLTGQQSAERRTRMLTANDVVVTDKQRSRLYRAIATYVIPYNRCVYRLALRHIKVCGT